MVQLADVYRQLLSPMDKTLKGWERGTGFKAKVGRWFRMGPVPPGQIETLIKNFNLMFMAYWPLFQRAWGPTYKRLFEMDMAPGKLFQIFARHRWLLLGWFGTTLIVDMNNDKMISRDPDYLMSYMSKYGLRYPAHNSL